MNRSDIFHRLVTGQSRGNSNQRRNKNDPQPEQILSVNSKLMDWAASPFYIDTFLPWLDERIEAAEVVRSDPRTLESHPLLAFSEGRVQELKNMKAILSRWSSQEDTE